MKEKNKSFMQGLAYGLMPHAGCIAFVFASIFGATILMQFFKPLLMNKYFFHALVLLSVIFATTSSVLYLKKNSLLSTAEIKKKWKYLSIMYGSTIGINLLLFLVIFPLLANVSAASSREVGAVNSNSDESFFSLIKLQVDIPCSGHASLISNELKSINGVESIKFSLPNKFDVTYDSTKTSKEQILALEIFKTYKAVVLEETK